MSEINLDTPLLNHSKALLLNISIHVDEQGLCYSKKNGTDIQIPTVIDNRRLRLPTHDFLSNPDFEKQVVFHPFSESVVRGESEMITWVKDRMVRRLSTMIGIMVMDFTAMAADGTIQKKLTTDQLSTIQLFGDADDKTLEVVSNLAEAILRDKGQWIHFYLRHSGKHGDKQAKRFCKVTFPVYKELLEETPKVCGVALRVKDRKFLKAVLEYIFDKIATEDGYSYGSNSEIAPYYHALIHAYAKVGVPMSSRIYLFRKHMERIANSRIHTEGWLDTFDEAAADSQFIRNMPYNVGTGGTGVGGEKLANAQTLHAGAPVVSESTNAAVEKANNQLNQIPNNASGLQQLINGGTLAPQPTTLSSVIGQSQPNVFGNVAVNNSPFGDVPRVGNVGLQTTPQKSVFGGTGQLPQSQPQNTGFNNNVFGRPQGSAFGGGQQNNGGNNPLAGLPRR